MSRVVSRRRAAVIALLGVASLCTSVDAQAPAREDSVRADSGAIPPQRARQRAERPRGDYQMIAEAQSDWVTRREDSRVNPDNIGRLKESDAQMRLYPSAELTMANIKVRADLKSWWTERSISPHEDLRSLRVEVQELRAGTSIGDHLYLVVGRQRLGWGPGMIWNPTRVEPQKDPLRIDNRLRGADAARLELTAGGTVANLLVMPRQLGQPAAVAARVERTLLGVATSASIVAPGTRDWRVGYDGTTAFDRFTLYFEGTARARSTRPTVDSLGALVARPTAHHVGTLYHDIVVGTLFTPTPGLQLVAEYNYRSDYLTSDEDARFRRFLPDNGQLYDPVGRGQHRLFAQIRRGDPGRSALTFGGFADAVTGELLGGPGFDLAGDRFELATQLYAFRDPHTVGVFHTQLQAVLTAHF